MANIILFNTSCSVFLPVAFLAFPVERCNKTTPLPRGEAREDIFRTVYWLRISLILISCLILFAVIDTSNINNDVLISRSIENPMVL